MKKQVWIAAAVLVALGSVGYLAGKKDEKLYAGDISEATVSYESTGDHTEEDLKATLELVKENFQKEFQNCTLLELWYDEKQADAENAWKEQYEGEEAIVLLSNFKTAATGMVSLNPNDFYENWQWVCVKDEHGSWQLETWGY